MGLWVVSFVDLGLWWIGALICGRFVGLCVCVLWFQRVGSREWWDLEEGGDRWVSQLDLILCFDGLVGFQFGDWCWFCELRRCRSFDFSGCMLGSNFWICRSVSGFDYWCMLISGFSIFVGICWFLVLIRVCWLLLDLSFEFWFVWL